MGRKLLGLSIAGLLGIALTAPVQATGIEVEASKYTAIKASFGSDHNPTRYDIGDIPALKKRAASWPNFDRSELGDFWDGGGHDARAERIAEILRHKERVLDRVREQLEQQIGHLKEKFDYLSEYGYDIDGKLPDLDEYPQFAKPLAPVPLPASAWMFFSGLAALGWIRKRRNMAAT